MKKAAQTWAGEVRKLKNEVSDANLALTEARHERNNAMDDLDVARGERDTAHRGTKALKGMVADLQVELAKRDGYIQRILEDDEQFSDGKAAGKVDTLHLSDLILQATVKAQRAGPNGHGMEYPNIIHGHAGSYGLGDGEKKAWFEL